MFLSSTTANLLSGKSIILEIALYLRFVNQTLEQAWVGCIHNVKWTARNKQDKELCQSVDDASKKEPPPRTQNVKVGKGSRGGGMMHTR